MSSRVLEGSYTSGEVSEDLTNCAAILLHGGVELFDLMLELAGCMGVGPAHRSPVASDEFEAPYSLDRRRLRLGGTLTSQLTGQSIPASAVMFRPPVLEATMTSFRVVVRRPTVRGGAYFGNVIVGAGSPPVPVWVQVP